MLKLSSKLKLNSKLTSKLKLNNKLKFNNQKTYKIGQYLVYKKDVCIIKEIKFKYIKDMDYYILNSITDKSLKIQVPTNNQAIRELISKKRAKAIIKHISTIEIIKGDSKIIEQLYKEIIKNGQPEDLMKIIKTTYLRIKEQSDIFKIADKENDYFEQAEKYLYNELSIVLNLNYEKIKEHIIYELDKLIK